MRPEPWVSPHTLARYIENTWSWLLFTRTVSQGCVHGEQPCGIKWCLPLTENRLVSTCSKSSEPSQLGLPLRYTSTICARILLDPQNVSGADRPSEAKRENGPLVLTTWRSLVSLKRRISWSGGWEGPVGVNSRGDGRKEGRDIGSDFFQALFIRKRKWSLLLLPLRWPSRK